MIMPTKIMGIDILQSVFKSCGIAAYLDSYAFNSACQLSHILKKGIKQERQFYQNNRSNLRNHSGIDTI